MATPWLNIPNALTMLRIAALPVYGWLWLRGSVAALYVLVPAVLSDWLDGFLARKLDQATPLGARLDPVADKMLVFISLVVALYRGAVPLWFVETIVVRDAIMAIGAIILMRANKRRYDKTVWKPTRLGKLATATLAGMIGLVLLEDLLLPGDALGVGLTIAMIVTAALSVATLVQYAVIGIKALRAPYGPRPDGDPSSHAS